jgi:HEPN domain-containing protein
VVIDGKDKKNYYLCIGMDTDKIVKHWTDSSDDDFATMLILYNAGSYGWALFMGHIALEKMLKAYYVKQHETHAPFTHNLYRLAELGGLGVGEEQAEWLFRITTFNINARYDDYKKEFYSLCTAEFTNDWIEKIKNLRQWIKTML